MNSPKTSLNAAYAEALAEYKAARDRLKNRRLSASQAEHRELLKATNEARARCRDVRQALQGYRISKRSLATQGSRGVFMNQPESPQYTEAVSQFEAAIDCVAKARTSEELEQALTALNAAHARRNALRTGKDGHR